MRDAPSPAVVRWLDAQPALDVFIPALVLAEIHFGVARLPSGHRRDRLGNAVIELADTLYRGRIVPFDERASRAYGSIAAHRRAEGRPIAQMDALIAATALAHDAMLATRNIRDFDDLDLQLVNPFDYLR